MRQHLRANLSLLLLTVVLCCVCYPLVLWAIGQTAFRYQAQGSLLDGNGRPVTRVEDAVGSRLIAQSFSDDKYFQPRPSAASYNAAASGGSNYGANNPLLRDRVARALTSVAKYRSGPRQGQGVGPDIDKWFAEKTAKQPDWAAEWAASRPVVTANWATSDDLIKAYVVQWADDHPEVAAEWRQSHPDATAKPKPEEIVLPFFASYVKVHPGTWPVIVERTSADGKKDRVVVPAKEGADIEASFFDTWLQENPSVDLENVPADKKYEKPAV